MRSRPLRSKAHSGHHSESPRLPNHAFEFAAGGKDVVTGHVHDQAASVPPHDQFPSDPEFAGSLAGTTEVPHMATGGVHDDDAPGGPGARPVQQVQAPGSVEADALDGGELFPIGRRLGRPDAVDQLEVRRERKILRRQIDDLLGTDAGGFPESGKRDGDPRFTNGPYSRFPTHRRHTSGWLSSRHDRGCLPSHTKVRARKPAQDPARTQLRLLRDWRRFPRYGIVQATISTPIQERDSCKRVLVEPGRPSPALPRRRFCPPAS